MAVLKDWCITLLRERKMIKDMQLFRSIKRKIKLPFVRKSSGQIIQKDLPL